MGACIGPDFGSLLPVRLWQQAEFAGADFGFARNDFAAGSASRATEFAVMKQSYGRNSLCRKWDDLRTVGVAPK